MVDEKVPKMGTQGKDEGVNADNDDELEEEEEEVAVKFKVIIERPEPSHVKISKKNCCIISIR